MISKIFIFTYFFGQSCTCIFRNMHLDTGKSRFSSHTHIHTHTQYNIIIMVFYIILGMCACHVPAYYLRCRLAGTTISKQENTPLPHLIQTFPHNTQSCLLLSRHYFQSSWSMSLSRTFPLQSCRQNISHTND